MTTDDTDTAATILSLARLLSDEHERAEEEKALRISTAQDLIASAKECDRLRAMHNRAADRAEEAEARLAAAERNREAAWGSEAQMAKEDLRAERARAEAAERRLAEASKPGPATERPACWAVVDGDAFKSVWTDESIARTMGEAVPLYRGWGRAELAARVADLESQLADARAEASKWYKAAADGIDAMGEHGRKEADALRARVAELKAEVEQERRLRCTLDEEDRAAWQAATSAATPGEVRRLTEAILRGAMFSALPGDADGASDLFRALTAPGPVVLPGATPSDEEIARYLYDATNVPGSYDDIPWSKATTFNRALWTSAVAKVVRPLLARPAVEAFDLPAIEWADHGDKLTFNASGINASAHLNAACWQISIFGSCAVGNEARATVERAHRLLTGTATPRPAQTDGPGNVLTDLDGPIVVPASAIEDDGEPAPALVDLMRRPAQTCPQCDAPEIHCAGCGTNASRAWECAECAAGGDAGREGDRLRDAVTDRSLAIRGLLGALTVAGMVVDASMANAVAPLYDATKALNAHLAAQPPAPLRDSWEARGGQHYAQAPAQVAQPAPFDFAAYVANQERWSTATFGPGPRHAGIIDHIRKELAEIDADPADLTEWVDVIILAIDGAWRCGGATGETLAAALAAKAAKNRARTWPDWRTAPPDKAIEHDRSGEPPPVEPAKGERFVVADRESANRAARLTKARVRHFLGLTSATNYARDCNADPSMFAPDDSCADIPAYTHAVVDIAPAPSDVARLAAALVSHADIAMSYAPTVAASILRHLAGPLPGVDHAEALIAAYVDAFAETSGGRWSEVDQKRKDHAIATMRRAMLAVGAQEPARVTVGEIVEAAYDPATGTREKYEATVRGFIGRTVAP